MPHTQHRKPPFKSTLSKHTPPVLAGFGRTPVRATVEGHAWDTSVWRDKEYGTLFAVPKHVRDQRATGTR